MNQRIKKFIAFASIGLFLGLASAAHAATTSNNDALNSTFMVEVFLDTGHTEAITGTAFLGPDHKLYTAKHLFAQHVNDIEIYDHKGQHVGEAILDHDYTAPTSDNAADFVAQDHTTLTLAQFDYESNPLSEMHFDDAKELKFAPITDNNIGEIDSPVGIIDGASGAPALNDQGEVIGLVSGTNAITDDNTQIVDISSYPSVIGHHTDDEPYNVAVPKVSHVFIAPLGNVDKNATNIAANTHITIPAYPRQRTIVYSGHIMDLTTHSVHLSGFETSVTPQ